MSSNIRAVCNLYVTTFPFMIVLKFSTVSGGFWALEVGSGNACVMPKEAFEEASPTPESLPEEFPSSLSRLLARPEPRRKFWRQTR
jgi:hypothetical protein